MSGMHDALVVGEQQCTRATEQPVSSPWGQTDDNKGSPSKLHEESCGHEKVSENDGDDEFDEQEVQEEGYKRDRAWVVVLGIHMACEGQTTLMDRTFACLDRLDEASDIGNQDHMTARSTPAMAW